MRRSSSMQPPEGGTWYSVLEVAESATAEEIKSAYRRLAKEYHPNSLPLELQGRRFATEGAEKFILIREAYEVLSNPLRRREHDTELARLRDTAKEKYSDLEQPPPERPAPAPPPRETRHRSAPPPPSRPSEPPTTSHESSGSSEQRGTAGPSVRKSGRWAIVFVMGVATALIVWLGVDIWGPTLVQRPEPSRRSAPLQSRSLRRPPVLTAPDSPMPDVDSSRDRRRLPALPLGSDVVTKHSAGGVLRGQAGVGWDLALQSCVAQASELVCGATLTNRLAGEEYLRIMHCLGCVASARNSEDSAPWPLQLAFIDSANAPASEAEFYRKFQPHRSVYFEVISMRRDAMQLTNIAELQYSFFAKGGSSEAIHFVFSDVPVRRAP